MIEKTISDKINNLMRESVLYSNKNNAGKAYSLLQEAWDLIPEDKLKYNESFYVAKYMVLTKLKHNELKGVKSWADKIESCGENYPDFGEKEHIRGRVSLALNELEKAKAFFQNAYKKSEGRNFTKDDSKYLKLIS